MQENFPQDIPGFDDTLDDFINASCIQCLDATGNNLSWKFKEPGENSD
ncbi:hypothetical protein ACFLXI_06845 [Chloroflexota bacterium]